MKISVVAGAVVLASVCASAAADAQAMAGGAMTTVRTQDGMVNVERLAQLEHPWGMAYLPDGRLLVTEKPGRLRVFHRGRLSAPIGGLPTLSYRSQGGLLDVAVDPEFAQNRMVYLSFTEMADQQPAGARETGDPRFGAFIDMTDNELKGGAVARGRLDGDRLSDVQVIWRQTPKMIGRGHFGGRILFGPDGKLYITSGDRMRFEPAQDPAGNLGRVVRINPDGSIPADNPRGAAGAMGDVFSMGNRNALGAAFHPTTGQLWINEMGPAGGDEVNVVTAGANYGWPVVSNGDNYDGSQIPDHFTSDRFVKPVASWTPVISPSGMLFHSGRTFPRWRGNILLGGLSSMSIVRLSLEGNRVAAVETIAMGKRIRDVIEAADGHVLALVDGPKGELLRLSPRRGR